MPGIQSISLFTAFSSGLLSFFSPCVLPLIPVYLSFISGLSFEQMTDQADRKKTFLKVLLNTFLFVIGFSTVFVLLGLGASSVGQFFESYKSQISLIAGLIIVILSIHFMGIFKIKWLYYEKRVQIKERRFGPFSSFLLGFAFAFGWTPCIGPILSTILMIASQQESANAGAVLLSFYSAGLAIPFLATAVFLNTFLGLFKKVNQYFDVVETAMGGVMLVAGTWLIFSQIEYLIPVIYPMTIVGIVMVIAVLLKKKIPPKAFSVLTGLLVAAVIICGSGLYIGTTRPLVEDESGSLALTFDNFSGSPLTIDSYKGKPVLLNFFASWCTPCKKEIPELIKIYNEKANGRFQIVGVNCDEEANDGKEMIEKLGIPYPVLHGDVNQLQLLGIRTALPTNIILDSSGKMVKDFTGFPGEAILMNEMELIIKQESSSK